MIKAKITARGGYKCAPEGHRVVNFPFASEVSGQVAEWAIADGAADPELETPAADPELETKVTHPPEVKRARGRPRKNSK